MSGDTTNLSSEFYVLSMLYRLELNAALTLGNKKSVDIIIARENGDALTVDVKGSRGITGFFAGNIVSKRNHFVVFVSYLDQFSNLQLAPEVYILPSSEVASVTRTSPSGEKVVPLTWLRRDKPNYRDNWSLLS